MKHLKRPYLRVKKQLVAQGLCPTDWLIERRLSSDSWLIIHRQTGEKKQLSLDESYRDNSVIR
ncbi:TPA: hypothetical protein ACGBG5_003488 [Enterococcus faecalis]